MNDLQNFKLNRILFFILLVALNFSTTFAKDRLPVVTPNPLPCLGHFHGLDYVYDFCDTCGCGSSGGSMGYGTGLNTNFIGVRYIGQQYRSRDGIFNDSPWVDENFNTMQLWGNFPVSKRTVVNVIVPYQFHSRNFIDGTSQNISGLGDASILAMYNLLKVKSDSIVSIKPEHYVQIGGGIKMPTGAFDKENNEDSVNPSFQLGTGSWDYVVAANYGFNYRNWGISTLVNYAMKTENPKQYQFGNQFNYALNAFKTYYIANNFSMTPILGIAGEVFETNKEYGADVANTKGDLFMGKVSLEASYSRYALGVVSMLPITQNLNNNKVELKNRLSIYLNVNF
ncbi:transporter [Cellulophaga sp. E16_2]|uniref:Transporter n=1 Tax=Cellulophaga algicola (strain DSM 14237 / IC166 / ACAM 630) TaxID=688270 RepID=E6X4U5_CELAD|nr:MULTISPECIES: hypothetical protein [Cellulophaga]ADV50437.1 hypothetical protein Celal_3163 [Cellulophaga algicola DSM 14237]MBO0592840.1 transporter [Cellulophaga sp. E16_2]